MEHRFVALLEDYEQVYLYDQDNKKVRQVLWGDWLRIEQPIDESSEWYVVLWAWNNEEKKQRLKVKKAHTTDLRPLEIIFVDVGQGDGAILITPERNQKERIMVIDAGDGDHMYEFLKDRFLTYRDGHDFHAAIVTHPDSDHYYGFHRIFNCEAETECKRITFEKFYHNGIAERPVGNGWEKLGGKDRDATERRSYLKNLVVDHEQMVSIFKNYVGKKKYPNTISSAIEKDLVGEFQMLSTKHGTLTTDDQGNQKCWIPEFSPDDNRDYQIEVLGPYIETDTNGKPRLRTLEGTGKTKNGHSVILKLRYGDFTVLFGGDLNTPAEKFLLCQYADIERWPTSEDSKKELVERAREVFQSDVMKTCHHGSSDVTDEFLKAVNPAAFVISSGDSEGHVHPRPDLLGRLGKFGRGDCPVLLSTELQRSTREKEDVKVVNRLRRNIAFQRKKFNKKREQTIQDDITVLGRSNVDVDGAIYLKTDGKRLITAFKKETGSEKNKWFYFEYQFKAGALDLVKK